MQHLHLFAGPFHSHGRPTRIIRVINRTGAGDLRQLRSDGELRNEKKSDSDVRFRSLLQFGHIEVALNLFAPAVGGRWVKLIV